MKENKELDELKQRIFGVIERWIDGEIPARVAIILILAAL